jgi:hypothetical protein
VSCAAVAEILFKDGTSAFGYDWAKPNQRRTKSSINSAACMSVLIRFADPQLGISKNLPYIDRDS